MPRCAAMFAGLGRRVRSLLAPLLMLALLPWAGAATPLFLSKATDLVPGNLAGSFSATPEITMPPMLWPTSTAWPSAGSAAATAST